MDVGHDRRHSSALHQGSRIGNAHWPARTQRLLEASCHQCVEGLQEPLRRCLSEFEKQLFAQAERAHHAGDQQDCFSSRQRVLQGRAAYTQRFVLHIGRAFNGIDSARSAPAAASPKPWQTLALVDPGEQEVSMSLEQLGVRGEVRHASVLYELGHRLAVLIGAPPLEGLALPLGPYALARACHEAGAELELPLKHQLMLLQHFDQWVIQALAPMYDVINAHLQGDGILPQLRSIPIPRHVGKRSRPVASSGAAAASEPAAAPTGAPHTGVSAGSGAPIEVLESLRDLLARQRASQSGVSGQAAGRAASEQELQSALGALQQHLAQLTDQAGRELRSAARLREELLAQLNAGKPGDAPRTRLSDEQSDKVELVARLFEQLGQQLQRGGNARQLLGDLQLPVLRMAVTDRGFFEQREHPARRLLDTVTAAANDWLDGSDDESNRPLASKLEQLVARASREPPSAGLYTTLLADIEHHLALLTRKAQAAERRHVEAAQGRERLDQARHRAGELMAERFALSPPRGLLRALLDRAWSDVLALTLLRHGEDSEAFDTQLAITDQLLGRLPVGDRRQLQAEVEAGLQRIGIHAEEAVQVAQRLLGAGAPDPVGELPSTTDLALRLKQHQRLGELQSAPPQKPALAPPAAAPEPSPRERDIEQHLRQLPFGSWFEFVDPASGRIARRKLAWYSPVSGHCLLVSQRGQRGEETSLAQLAREVASGRACEVPAQPESLLDRAWRSLTGSLRQATAPRRHAPPEDAHR